LEVRAMAINGWNMVIKATIIPIVVSWVGFLGVISWLGGNFLPV
jgi:hypothetical protein